MSLPANFLAKTRKTDCTVWIGATNNKGYGILQVDGKRVLAHRVAYEAEYGPIPDDLRIDHVCRVRNCVNPLHLEPVTHGENTRRGYLAIGGICTNGHELTEDGIYVRPNGKSECQECRRIGKRANRRGEARPTQTRRAPAVAAALEALTPTPQAGPGPRPLRPAEPTPTSATAPGKGRAEGGAPLPPAGSSG